MPPRERSCATPSEYALGGAQQLCSVRQAGASWPGSAQVSPAVAQQLAATEAVAPWSAEWVVNRLAAALAGAGTSDHVYPCRRRDGRPGEYTHVVKLVSRAEPGGRAAAAREAHILSDCLRGAPRLVRLSEMWQTDKLAYLILRQALGVAWPRARAALHGAASAPPLWARGVEAQRGVERRWRLIAAALLEALAEVHRANVAHLDLRPEHVFVARDGASGAFSVSLLDFSRACELGPSGREAAGERAPAPGEPAQRRGAPLPLRDSLRAGLLLAELLFNVPADYACAQQRAMPFLGRGVAAARAATRGCASAAALDLLERLCAPDAAQRLLPSQALYLPALD